MTLGLLLQPSFRLCARLHRCLPRRQPYPESACCRRISNSLSFSDNPLPSDIPCTTSLAKLSHPETWGSHSSCLSPTIVSIVQDESKNSRRTTDRSQVSGRDSLAVSKAETTEVARWQQGGHDSSILTHRPAYLMTFRLEHYKSLLLRASHYNTCFLNIPLMSPRNRSHPHFRNKTDREIQHGLEITWLLVSRAKIRMQFLPTLS